MVYRRLWDRIGTEAGIYGPKTRLFYSLGKELCTKRFWKSARLSIGGSVWEPGGGLFTGGFERQATIWRTPPLGSPRDV
jgi:hypothetical protein